MKNSVMDGRKGISDEWFEGIGQCKHFRCNECMKSDVRVQMSACVKNGARVRVSECVIS